MDVAKRFFALLLCMLLCLMLPVGCKGNEEEEPLAYEENSEAGFRRTMLYYGADGGFVVPVMKKIPWEEGIGKAALGYLVDNAENRTAALPLGLNALVPAGTTFSLRIADGGEATVDLMGLTELPGETDEQRMVTAIVNTLTAFDSINTVRITLDGAKADTLPHGTDISRPLGSQPLNVEEGQIAVSSGNAHLLTLYFPNASASLNVPVSRYVDSQPTLSTAVSALLQGPAADGLAAFPKGTALRSAYVADGVACVDLSAEFKQAAATDGLCSALQDAITLTANELEPVYGTDIYVEGEPYALHTAQVSAPVYVNEF